MYSAGLVLCLGLHFMVFFPMHTLKSFYYCHMCLSDTNEFILISEMFLLIGCNFIKIKYILCDK